MNKHPRLRVQRLPFANRDEWLALRKEDVTASVVGALYGIHPYQTIMGLYAEKTGTLIPDEDNISKRRGRLLEGAVAAAYQEKHPSYKITKASHYYRVRGLRLGATPDFSIIDDQRRHANLQAKTVAPLTFQRSWTDETPPTWIALQCLTEAMLTRAEYGVIAALVVDGYRFDLHEYIVPRHEAAERRIMDSVAKFWDDIAAGRVPEFQAADRPLLGVMFPREKPGLTVDLRGDNELPGQLRRLERCKHFIGLMKEWKDAIETSLIAKIGFAETALVNDWRITLRHQHRSAHMVKASDFRQLRIAREREKA